MKNRINDYKVTTSIFLDKSRPSVKSNTYPVRLRIIFQRKVKYYATGINLTNEENEFIFNPKPKQKIPDNLKNIKLDLAAKETRAKEIIDKLENFSFDTFEKKFFEKPLTKNFYSIIEQKRDDLIKAERIGTANTFDGTLKSLRNFKKDLSIDDITISFLNDYKKYMLKKGKSLTTIGMYLRNVRTLINESPLFNKENYPFGKDKFVIPSGANIKKALDFTDIEKIYNADLQNNLFEKYRDFFILSYLGNGVNISDIARLKFKNINDNTITFVREKTKKTTENKQKTIAIPITPEIKAIIDRYANKNTYPDNYIFSILTNDLSPVDQHKKIKFFTKLVNKHIKQICSNLGIEKNVSTYTARHSFATILKNSNVPISFISESLGHQNIKTTELYLGSFADNDKTKFLANLTNFKK